MKLINLTYLTTCNTYNMLWISLGLIESFLKKLDYTKQTNHTNKLSVPSVDLSVG